MERDSDGVLHECRDARGASACDELSYLVELIVIERNGDLRRGHTGHHTIRGPSVPPPRHADRLPAGVIARVDLRAPRLTPDDYVIELYGAAARGVEQRTYFLHSGADVPADVPGAPFALESPPWMCRERPGPCREETVST